jgi:hypothetical protein
LYLTCIISPTKDALSYYNPKNKGQTPFVSVFDFAYQLKSSLAYQLIQVDNLSVALIFHKFSSQAFCAGLVVFSHKMVAVPVKIWVYPVIESGECGRFFFERIFHEPDTAPAPLCPYRIVIKVYAVETGHDPHP